MVSGDGRRFYRCQQTHPSLASFAQSRAQAHSLSIGDWWQKAAKGRRQRTNNNSRLLWIDFGGKVRKGLRGIQCRTPMNTIIG